MCIEISKIWDNIYRGNDENHVHFFSSSVCTISVENKVVATIKSITALEIFKEFPKLRKICAV